MLGVDRARWRGPLFSRVLPALQREWHGDAAYIPSTPYGGDLPFHVGTGVTHYYGVGAYRRPIADVRRDHVAFTSECLAFAQVPEPDVISEFTSAHPPATHDPRWKQRTPRDSGAGWDFEDVRDHYVRDLFGVDPTVLRSADPLRYLELSRVTTAEVMARVFAEWRSTHSRCGGGLVWFLQDLWPGAGWGILDSHGRPKSSFFGLKRAWQPRAVVLTDEGLDGLHVHAINETDEPWTPTLELRLIRHGRATPAHADTPCELGPRERLRFSAESLLGGFHDITYAYRFGPPAHDAVAATLRDVSGAVASRAWWIRDAAALAAESCGAVMAEARAIDASTIEIAVTSERLLAAVRLDTPDFDVDDNYFHVLPGETALVRARARRVPAPRFAGAVEALNLDGAIPIDVRTTPRVVTR
jgi:beta-mannosidase